jgi:hypothetical protein
MVVGPLAPLRERNTGALWIPRLNNKTAQAEPVEALSFPFFRPLERKQPFDKLRVSGGKGRGE